MALRYRDVLLMARCLMSLDCLSEISAYTSSGKKLLYDRGGYVNQIKQPKAYSFERFSESMNDPKAFLGHEYKLYRAGLMHLLFRYDRSSGTG